MESRLSARLTLTDAVLLVIGAVIGSGIFLTTGIIARSLPDPGWILFVWIAGAVLSLFGGLTLAELGAMLPEAGGQYVYLKEAYGPAAGFIYGWLAFLVNQTGGIAALAIGFATYLSFFIPVLGVDRLVLDLGFWSVSAAQVCAVLSIVILTTVNYFGIRSGSIVQNFFTLLKILAIMILVTAGLLLTFSPEAATARPAVQPGAALPLYSGIGVALIAVLWTFDGWYAINTVASEVKNPQRHIPLSLIIGISAIGLIYVLINLFYLKALPMEEMIGVQRVGEKAVTYYFGPTAGSVMSGLILVSIAGCLSATILFGPRIFYAMARDGYFFRSFARVHPDYSVPGIAIIGQGVWSGILCLTGTYEQLFTYVIFTSLLFSMANALAVIRLRRKQPDRNRPYRVWGYPVVPVVFGLSMLLIAVNSLLEKPVESMAGIVFMIAGIFVFKYWYGSRGGMQSGG